MTGNDPGTDHTEVWVIPLKEKMKMRNPQQEEEELHLRRTLRSAKRKED